MPRRIQHASQTATWVCCSAARDPELGHQHRGNSLGRKGPRKHDLGAVITAGLPALPNTDVRTAQRRGKSPLAIPHLVPLSPHVQNPSLHRSLSISENSHKGNNSAVTMTHLHHRGSAFRRKCCFSDSPANKFTDKRAVCWTGGCRY